MIEKLFVETLEVSLAVALLILVFMLCSAGIGKRYAAKWKYRIWLVIAVRMLVPLNPDLSFGRLELAVPEEFARENPIGQFRHTISEGLSRDILSVGLSKGTPADPAASGTGKEENARSTVKAEYEGKNGTEPTIPRAKPAEDKTVDDAGAVCISLMDILAVLWLCGACLLFGGHLIAYLRFRRSVLKEAQDAEDEDILGIADEILARTNCRNRPRILLLDEAVSPMVIGFVRPCLLLPKAEYSREELTFILKHELTHCRRHDSCYKLLLVAAWSIHWFNPLAWLMVKQAGVDLELSCDEEVVANEPYAVRRAYTQTLLAACGRQCSRKAILTTQWSGGVKMMKKRFKHIIEPSKNKNGLALVALALVLMLASGSCMACGARVFAAEPEEQAAGKSGPQQNMLPIVTDGQSGKKADAKEIFAAHNEFILVSDGGTRVIGYEDIPALFYEDIRLVRIWKYAVMDLEGDGQDEIILFVADAAGDLGGTVILHQIDNLFYAYPADNRTLVDLKADGSYQFSDPTGLEEAGIAVITAFSESGYTDDKISYASGDYESRDSYVVEHEPATEDEYRSAVSLQENKQDVEWYEFDYGVIFGPRDIAHENVDVLPEPGTEDVNEETGADPVYVYQSESDALKDLITDRALKFFWAWARADQDALKRCTADIAESYSYPLWTAADEGYDPEKITDACVKEIRFDAEDADVAYVSVEFRMAEDDYFQYMEMELVKRGDSWKVYGAGLEM